MNIVEGHVPFGPYQTYFRVSEVGSCLPPLLLIHGGPGSTHNYFEVFDHLAQEMRRDIIMYDQLGCGGSYVEGHSELFTAEVWLEELKNLIKFLGRTSFHILGQSWGGMLALLHALDTGGGGACSYILSSTLPSAALWEAEQQRRISYMPQNEREALKRARETGNYEDREYLAALDKFMALHSDPIMDTLPECLTRKKRSGRLSYVTAWGENEFSPTGTLSGFDVTERLHEIKVPCLICSGQRDLCSPYIAKTMYDRLPSCSWELFRLSGHMPFIEEHEKYCAVLEKWLSEHDRTAY